MIFLIHYDRRAGTIKAFQAFVDTDRDDAEAARLAIELSESGGTDREVVLLEAQSETELRKTHRRYFATATELARSAADEATTASTKAS
jgi:hypothetical protein